MQTTPELHSQTLSHFDGVSLSELQKTLKELKQMRTLRKQAGKKANLGSNIRVELPVGSDKASALPLLQKLSILDASGKINPTCKNEILTDIGEIHYTENPKLIGWIRIFVGDTLYDGSFTILTQKINH